MFQTNPPEDWKEVTIHWLKTSSYYDIPWIKKFVRDLQNAVSDREILSLKNKLEKFLKVLEEGGELERDEIDEINRALLWGTIGIGSSGIAEAIEHPEVPEAPRPRELVTYRDFEEFSGVRLREPTSEEIKEALRIPSDFGYSGDLPIGETWAIGPVIRTRDSNIREESNADALEKALKKIPQFEDEYEIVHAGHWAVGWVDHLAFHAVDEDGEPTTIFRWLNGWNDNLENYPIADEEDLSEREHELKIENIKDEASRIEYGVPIESGDWAGEVLEYLEEHPQDVSRQTRRFFEDPENYGVDKNDVEMALRALDSFKPNERFEVELVSEDNNLHDVKVYTDDYDSAMEDGVLFLGDGFEWESTEDHMRAFTVVPNSKDLQEKLEAEGYTVDTWNWIPSDLPGQMQFPKRVLPELLEDVPEHEVSRDEVKVRIQVKGNENQVLKAASDRGFKIDFNDPINPGTENIIFTVEGSHSKLIEWYAEPPNRAPFPVGTLIHFHIIEEY